MTDPKPAGRRRRRGRAQPAGTAREQGDAGLRDLVGAGPSQLGVSKAMRARDVNRPTDDDLAAAQHETVIVRRHWTPPS